MNTHSLAVNRTARFHTLGVTGRDVAELWILLHGYGQLAGQFLGYCATIATPERLLVAPEALNRFYLVQPAGVPAAERPVGATWMTREARDADVADNVAYLDRLVDHLGGELPALRRVRVLGFSQGAATAARWALLGRTRVSDVILWGGLTPPDLDLPAWRERGIPLTVVVGDADEHLPDAAVAAEEARLREAGIAPRVVRFRGGHVIRRAALQQVADRAG